MRKLAKFLLETIKIKMSFCLALHRKIVELLLKSLITQLMKLNNYKYLQVD
jgi:hypothetical protein